MTTRPRAGGPLLAVLLLATAALACPACETRQHLRRISLNLIKQQILAKLGLESAPNITARQLPRIPPLDHLYEKMQSDQPLVEDHDDNEVTFEKVIAFAQPHPKVRHWRGKELLQFQFSEKVLENKVLKASLWLYLRPSHEPDLQPAVLTVHRLTKADPPAFIPYFSKMEPRPRGTRGRWVFLDVKRLVSEWFKLPGENAGLAVGASVAGQDQLYTKNIISISTDTDSSNFVPFLEVHIADSRKHRSKRTISLNCPENSEETRCCRYPLTVDFEEFGWDWIIAPKKYEANYCSGECPYVFLTKYPHTHIVHLANPSGTSGPCCAPRKMSSISMLYFDQSFNIIYGLLPGMVVDRCGCS